MSKVRASSLQAHSSTASQVDQQSLGSMFSTLAGPRLGLSSGGEARPEAGPQATRAHCVNKKSLPLHPTEEKPRALEAPYAMCCSSYLGRSERADTCSLREVPVYYAEGHHTSFAL